MIIKANSIHMPLKDKSVQAIFTSPPYFGALRDYDIPDVLFPDAWMGQLGQETGPEHYVVHLMQVIGECWRVIKSKGILFVNIGDKYQKSSLCLIPERFIIACREQGWLIRNKPIWEKSNYLPHAVKNKFDVKWEQIYMLVKQTDYYFNLDAIRIAPKPSTIDRAKSLGYSKDTKYANFKARPSAHRNYKGPNPKGINPADIWKFPTAGYTGNHYAAFPEKLVERMLLCSTKPGDIVLDPFGGSGTVGRVAIRYRRRPVLLDLGYQGQQVERMKGVQTVLC